MLGSHQFSIDQEECGYRTLKHSVFAVWCIIQYLLITHTEWMAQNVWRIDFYVWIACPNALDLLYLLRHLLKCSHSSAVQGLLCPCSNKWGDCRRLTVDTLFKSKFKLIPKGALWLMCIKNKDRRSRASDFPFISNMSFFLKCVFLSGGVSERSTHGDHPKEICVFLTCPVAFSHNFGWNINVVFSKHNVHHSPLFLAGPTHLRLTVTLWWIPFNFFFFFLSGSKA